MSVPIILLKTEEMICLDLWMSGHVYLARSPLIQWPSQAPTLTRVSEGALGLWILTSTQTLYLVVLKGAMYSPISSSWLLEYTAIRPFGEEPEKYSSTMAFLVAQRIKHLPAMQETRVWSLGWEDPLEKKMATHSSILAWRIPWTEEPGRLQSTGLQKVGHDWMTSLYFFTSCHGTAGSFSMWTKSFFFSQWRCSLISLKTVSGLKNRQGIMTFLWGSWCTVFCSSVLDLFLDILSYILSGYTSILFLRNLILWNISIDS